MFQQALRLLFKTQHHLNSHLRHKEEIQNRSWHFFRWEVWVILACMLVVALLNIIPNWFVDTSAAHNNVAQMYYLRNNIIYSSISVFTTIGVAIFIGVFTEMGKYVGKFGSAIFILVPALLWLFSERGEENEGLENVVSAAKQAADVVFWITIGCIGIFALGSIIYYFVSIQILNPITKERFEYWNNFAYRMMLLIINILIIVMMAYALINYALFSLHLGDLTHQEKQKIADEEHVPIDEVFPIVFHNDRIVVFHSVVTAFFAILMILIGLTNFVKESREEIQEKKLDDLKKEESPNQKQLDRIARLEAQIIKKRPVQYAFNEEDMNIGGQNV